MIQIFQHESVVVTGKEGGRNRRTDEGMVGIRLPTGGAAMDRLYAAVVTAGE